MSCPPQSSTPQSSKPPPARRPSKRSSRRSIPMKVSGRRLALLACAALAVLTGGLGIATAQAAATPACRVDYKITSQWDTGFGADVTITNLGPAVTGWTLGWSLAQGQGITQAWNATVTV